jgi:hypothetical protein
MVLQPSECTCLQAVEACKIAKSWTTCLELERASTRVAHEQDVGHYERSVPPAGRRSRVHDPCVPCGPPRHILVALHSLFVRLPSGNNLTAAQGIAAELCRKISISVEILQRYRAVHIKTYTGCARTSSATRPTYRTELVEEFTLLGYNVI